MTTSISLEHIKGRIHTIRGCHVILDADIAALYQVQTKALVRAVQRNINRFPPDFMFQLTHEEYLRSQTGTSKKPGRGGRRYLPYAFTEQGVGMLASVLRSERAAELNIAIVRAFVAMRQLIASNAELAKKLDDLERKYDGRFKMLFAAIRNLMAPTDQTKPTRGFGR
jgi:hypothetical protein